MTPEEKVWLSELLQEHMTQVANRLAQMQVDLQKSLEFVDGHLQAFHAEEMAKLAALALPDVDIAAIAKAVNDDAARRMQG